MKKSIAATQNNTTKSSSTSSSVPRGASWRQSSSIFVQGISKTIQMDQYHKYWKPMKQHFQIGRLVYANPAEGCKYYLHIILNHVRGAMSYELLRTIRGVVYATWRCLWEVWSYYLWLWWISRRGGDWNILLSNALCIEANVCYLLTQK
jgi:hypothetical protein